MVMVIYQQVDLWLALCTFCKKGLHVGLRRTMSDIIGSDTMDTQELTDHQRMPECPDMVHILEVCEERESSVFVLYVHRLSRCQL